MKSYKTSYVNREVKQGAFVGALFAGIAYLWTILNGFNSSTFIPMLYLYILLGATSQVRFEHLASYWERLEQVLVIADEEENKLKKIATGEEYKVEGTIKKI